MLLKRRDMEHFRSTVSIKISADILTKMRSAFKTDPKDDDVWFDPNREPTSRLRGYDVDNLGTFGLESVFDVTYRTLLPEDAMKEELA